MLNRLAFASVCSSSTCEPNSRKNGCQVSEPEPVRAPGRCGMVHAPALFGSQLASGLGHCRAGRLVRPDPPGADSRLKAGGATHSSPWLFRYFPSPRHDCSGPNTLCSPGASRQSRPRPSIRRTRPHIAATPNHFAPAFPHRARSSGVHPSISSAGAHSARISQASISRTSRPIVSSLPRFDRPSALRFPAR